MVDIKKVEENEIAGNVRKERFSYVFFTKYKTIGFLKIFH